MYVLFTDSDTDMTPEIAKKYGYNLISMPYSMDEKEIYPYQSFEKFEYKEFYDKLRKGAMPKTSGLSPVTYMEYFEPFLKEGKDILYVHFSEKMSGTFDSMRLAIEQLKEKYPNNNVYTIDTKAITALALLILEEIGDMYVNGKSIEEIKEWSEKEITHFCIYFFVEDLSFFKRSGRVSGMAAVMGNILAIRPIIHMDEEGNMVSIDKCKGTKATISKLVGMIKENALDIEKHKVIIAHSDALENAQAVAQRLQEEYNNKLDIEYVVVNPTAGSHCGPNAVGICFHSIHR